MKEIGSKASETAPSSERRHRIRNDIILVAAILLIALAVLLVFLLGGNTGSKVRVLINGELTAEYALSENVTVPITAGQSGEYTNILVIEGGKASVSDADCPDKICVSHWKISKSGETIVCLPHRLVIEIE